MDNRKPILSDDRKFRIISVPNGLWQVQTRTAEHGTRTQDCWQNLQRRSGDLHGAKRAMIAAGGTLID